MPKEKCIKNGASPTTRYITSEDIVINGTTVSKGIVVSGDYTVLDHKMVKKDNSNGLFVGLSEELFDVHVPVVFEKKEKKTETKKSVKKPAQKSKKEKPIKQEKKK